MSVADLSLAGLLAELRSKNVELDPQGDDLRCRAPKGVLTPELRTAILENKKAILSLLREEAKGPRSGDGPEALDALEELIGWCIHRWFDRQALRVPDRVAAVSEDQQLTYGELREQSSRLAEYLRSQGAAEETPVALHCEPSLQALVGLMGTLKAGAACLLVDPAHPDDASPRVEVGLPRVVLTAEQLAETLRSLGRPSDDWGLRSGGSQNGGDRAFDETHLALVLPTSGTAGKPRWVELEHRTVASAAIAFRREVALAEEDVLFVDAPLFSSSALLEIFASLTAGSRLVVSRPSSGREPDHHAAEASRFGATLQVATPSLWRRLVGADWQCTPSTRAVSTGEVLDRPLAGRLQAGGAVVWNLYACAEASLLSAMHRYVEPAAAIPIGRPACDQRMYVLDSDLQPVPTEVIGELYIGGAGLARGYSDGPEWTGERFIPDPFGADTGGRLFRTGDRARWLPDGTIQVLGRIPNALGSHRSGPDTDRVEALLREHPQVADIAIDIELDDARRQHLVAYMVARPGEPASISALRQFVKRHLPSHLEPSRFVELDRLPLTPAGKVDQERLRSSGAELIVQAPVTRRLPGEELDEVCRQTNMTKNQLLVWAGQKLEPDVPLYNIAALFVVSGPVDRVHLERAFQGVLDGSDALRTVIEEVGGVPRSRVLPPFAFSIEYLDFSGSPDPDSRLRIWARERCQVPFDLTKRLFDSFLVKLSEQRFAWYLVQHHLITDAWSVGIVYRRVEDLYRQSLSGCLNVPAVLPPFAEYVAFEQEKRETDAYRRAKEHWQRKLAEDIEPIEFFRNAPPNRSTRVERVSYDLGWERSQRVKERAGERDFAASSGNLALFTIFAAALLAFLYRISGNRLQSLGTTILNRPSKPFKETVGLFMQVAPLRVELAHDETFRSLAKKLKAEMLETMRHQRYALGNSPQRPLHEFLLNFETVTNDSAQVRFNGAPVEVTSVYKGHAHDKLALLVRDYAALGEFVLDFDFHCDFFDASDRERTYRYFARLLESLCESPDGRLSQVSLLSADEVRQVVVELNPAPLPGSGKTVVDLFHSQVNRAPDRVAIVCDGEQLTYSELNRRANQLARRLRSLGVGSESRVGIRLPRSVDLITAILGVLKAGGAYAALDPALSQERLAFILNDSGARLVLTREGSASDFSLVAATIVTLDSHWKDISKESGENLPQQPLADNLAYAIYTSGSTGRPKGVMIAHRSWANAYLAWEDAYHLRAHEMVHLQMANFSFDVFSGDLARGLCSGGRLILCPQEILLTPEGLYPLMVSENVQCAEFVPVVLRGLIEYLAEKERPLRGMRLLIVGSDSWYPHEHRQAQKLCGPETRFLNTYGVTEATIDSSFYESGAGDSLGLDGMVPIGRAFANTQMYLLDSSLQPVPLGIPGELFIGGPGVARGYLNRPALTAERFLPNPFAGLPGSRLYRTGDLARYLAGGDIQFLGRKDRQVKIRGFRVELGEIEAVLAQHPAVDRAVVHPSASPSGLARLAAYIVPAAGTRPTVGELRAFLQKQLPEYMVPSAYVSLERLPILPSGKIDRRALPPPELSSSAREAYVPPATPAEKELARIWCEVLEIDRVGTLDNFFDLGGHSLLAVKLLSRIREASGKALSLPQLFENPTISQLAHALESSDGEGPVSESAPVDLDREAVLDPTIGGHGRRHTRLADPGKVLLTGASGFLGAFLLHELLTQTTADVYCLVRSPDEETGLKRIRENLERYSVWEESLATRIIALPGDLAKPRLGLTEEQFHVLAAALDVLYHSGARVHALYSYATLKPTNVLGTEEVLRLASTTRLKPVHYVSTVSVLSLTGHAKGHVILEDDPLDSLTGLAGGYTQSKWVAEKLVTTARARGIPVSIYRPGLVTGHSQTGVSGTDELWYRLLQACIAFGSVPVLESDIKIDMAPVDYVSRAIVHLSRRETSLGKTFHLVNPNPVQASVLLDWIRSLGFDLRDVSYDLWRQELARASGSVLAKESFSLLPLFPEHRSPEPGKQSEMAEVDCTNTLDGLEESFVRCPPADSRLLGTYMAYLLRTGYFDPPPDGRFARPLEPDIP